MGKIFRMIMKIIKYCNTRSMFGGFQLYITLKYSDVNKLK
jgi:hypothetical protein